MNNRHYIKANRSERGPFLVCESCLFTGQVRSSSIYTLCQSQTCGSDASSCEVRLDNEDSD